MSYSRVGRYDYKNREFTGRRCSKVEMWTADGPRFWYEHCGDDAPAIAIHCQDCRDKKQPKNAQRRSP
jgi:hypothetical protein